MIPERCDDSDVMRMWRECGLPEFFLGNGGSNAKLVQFAKLAAETKVAELTRELEDLNKKHSIAWSNCKTSGAKVAEQAATDRNAKRSIIHALGMNSAALADWTWDQIAYRVGRQHQERSGLSHDKVTQAATIDELTQERERLTDKWSKLLDKSNKQAATIAELIRQRDMHACNAVSMMGQNEDKAATIERLTSIKSTIDYRLNDYLCEMKPEYDDSITGFNEAWDIVRKAFADAALSTQEPL